jgi:hypothetical protein
LPSPPGGRDVILSPASRAKANCYSFPADRDLEPIRYLPARLATPAGLGGAVGYFTVKPKLLLVPPDVVTVMVYTWVPLLTGIPTLR